MSSQNVYYTNGYPDVASNPIAKFLMYQPASTVIYPKNVNSNVVPCQPNAQSFNTVNSSAEIPPCQATLKGLSKAQYPLYPTFPM